MPNGLANLAQHALVAVCLALQPGSVFLKHLLLADGVIQAAGQIGGGFLAIRLHQLLQFRHARPFELLLGPRRCWCT